MLDQPYFVERKLELLKFLCARHSIPRTDWIHVYCHDGKVALPKKKEIRMAVMTKGLEDAKAKIEAAKPYVLVGLGRLPCEVLTIASILSTKAGTCWETKLWGKVWISYSPDAALYNPGLIVQISRIIKYAAQDAGIETKPVQVPMFRFEEYEFKHK